MGQILDRLYDKNTGKVNLDFFNTDRAFTPYLENLRTQGYHSEWHNEGPAINHMIKVHDAMVSLCEKYSITGNARMILVVSAFLHDIGKAVTGELKENGDWSFPSHAPKGGKIVRNILWDEDIEVREAISWLVRNHMKPSYVRYSKHKEKNMLRLAYECPFLKDITTLRNLYLIKLSDIMGSDRTNKEDDTEESLDYFKALAIDLRIWDSPIHSCDKYEVESGFDLYRYFRNENTDKLPSKTDNNSDFTVYIMQGVSGSGKSTFIKNNATLSKLPIVSKDSIQEEMGIITYEGQKTNGTKSQKKQVVKIHDNRVSELIGKKESFVIDNMNLFEAKRALIINEVVKNGGKPVIVYIEAKNFKTIVDRRDGEISERTLRDLRDHMQFPLPMEAAELWIQKEGNDLIIYPDNLKND